MSSVEPSPAVYGIETEYSMMVTLPGNTVYEFVGSCHSEDAKLGLYVAPSNKSTSSISMMQFNESLQQLGITSNSSGMLSNGGRFYIDPSGPEYDTAETSTAEEAVHRCFDGDDILLAMFERFRRSGVVEGYQINRRIVDHNRTSRGIHLNTTTSLGAGSPSSDTMRKLAALNVIKGAMFGSGGLLLDEHGRTQFHHSPRLSLTNEVAGHYSNYSYRPLVRIPFKEDGEFGRIETVTSDALSFAWPLRASLVLTNEVVALIELNRAKKLPTLRDPLRAAHVVGKNGSGRQISVIESTGRFVGRRPLELLRDVCELILEADDELGHMSPESREVVPEIIKVADKMANDFYSVAMQVESVARYAAIMEKIRRGHHSIGSEQICRFDYLWDKLDGGIAEKLRKSNRAGWQGFSTTYDPANTKRRITTPPQDTRAKIRGDLIKSDNGQAIYEWHSLPLIPSLGGGTPVNRYVHPLTSKA